MELLPLEHAVLERLLDREGPTFEILRAQLAATWVVDREFTGVGFYTTLAVPHEAPRLGMRMDPIHDVSARIPGLEHGADGRGNRRSGRR